MHNLFDIRGSIKYNESGYKIYEQVTARFLMCISIKLFQEDFLMKKSFNLVAAIALLAVGALASCGNNTGKDEGPKDITLTCSGPTDNQTFYEGLLPKFVEARSCWR